MHYYFVILVFALGAAAGALMSLWLGERAIWMAGGLLLGGFLIMFVKEGETGPRDLIP